MSRYYKATREDGTDFYSGTIDYAAAVGGDPIELPESDSYQCCSDSVLHASDVPTETLSGGWWPCRLFEVEGESVAQEGHKCGFRSLRVLREVDAHLAFGPQGREVAALIERASALTGDEIDQLRAAGDAAWYAAWALVVRDLIGHGFTQEHYDILTGPWRTVVGRIHPDDADLQAGKGNGR